MSVRERYTTTAPPPGWPCETQPDAGRAGSHNPALRRQPVPFRAGRACTCSCLNLFGEVVLFLERYRLGGRAVVAFAAREVAAVAPDRPRRRIAANELFQICQVDELVGLPPQLIGDHRRLRLQRGHHAHTASFLLQRSDEALEI